MKKRMSSASRRKQIVESVGPLFAEKGFTGTTTKEMADAAGISEALLYKHFPSKESLYRELQDICVESCSSIADFAMKSPPSTDTLIRVVYVVAAVCTSPLPRDAEELCVVRLLLFGILENSPFVREFLSKERLRWEGAISASLAAAREEDAFVEGLLLDDLNAICFFHHLCFAFKAFGLHRERAIDYPQEKAPLLDQIVLFALRGIGLKNEVLKLHYRAKELECFFQEHFASLVF